MFPPILSLSSKIAVRGARRPGFRVEPQFSAHYCGCDKVHVSDHPELLLRAGDRRAGECWAGSGRYRKDPQNNPLFSNNFLLAILVVGLLLRYVSTSTTRDLLVGGFFIHQIGVEWGPRSELWEDVRSWSRRREILCGFSARVDSRLDARYVPRSSIARV